MARIVLGVGGGIAAYKACSLLRMLTEHGHDVTVLPTNLKTALVMAANAAGRSKGKSSSPTPCANAGCPKMNTGTSAPKGSASAISSWRRGRARYSSHRS